MKFKTKKLTILAIIGLIVPLFLNYSYTFNIKHDYNLIEPKESAGYSESFIHIDGSIPGNWTATLAEPWCNLINGIYVIENVTIDSPTGSGIFIQNSKNEFFIIRNCSVQNAGTGNNDAGIRLENTSNGTLIENNCSNNGRSGIRLYNNCYNNTITNNTANNNAYLGIGIYGINGVPSSQCVDNIVENNIANDNDLHGIVVAYYCQNTTVVDNECSFNGQYGIFLYLSCLNNYIINNTANNNGVSGEYAGIYLSNNCDYNNVIGNNASNEGTTYQDRGIYIYNGCDFNNITDNIINDNTGTGIHLYFNSDSNVIKNNTINRNDLGIGLYWSDSNIISGNTLKDNSWCIYEINSVGNIIEYNDCSPPTVQEPIFIDATATGVGAHNWTWAVSQSWCSGSGTWNDPYIIENLKINGFEFEIGIEIRNSDVSFIIQDCLIYNSNYAIYLEEVNNSRLINNNCSNIDWGIHLERSNNNTISGNTANGHGYDGIYLTECMGNTLSGNTANNNGDSGIHLQTECMNNTLSGNIANDNGDLGIDIEEDCSNNTISGNTANDNGDSGIYIDEDCSNNTISGNTANDNGDSGIYLYYECNKNIISGNTANNNTYNGIYIEEDCSNNTISGNTANDNGDYGISLYWYCQNNTIIDNIATYNGLNGIGIYDFSDNNILTENLLYNNTIGVYIDNSDNNSIYENFFAKNEKHAFDDGIDNKWNSTIIGNYWDNHTSPDVSPQDGIVDNPYIYIEGPAGSIDYLPIAEDGAPRITIISPIEDRRFGSIAPSFNVEVIDVYVYEMWYTIDGGLHNYSFTENGMINQSAWDALPEGSVTITFYASDIIGNEAFEEVTVTKSISAGGLDPGVIAVIIALSVIGGVALLGAILVILVKKGKISLEKIKRLSFRRK